MMPLVLFKQEYIDELEVIYKKNPEWMEMQKLETLDRFIEEMTMFGLTQFRRRGRNVGYILHGVKK